MRTTIKWEEPSKEEWDNGIRVKLLHFKPVTQVTWHGRGDYFASVMPEGLNRSVLINQLSRRRSQLPFTKSKGLVQCVLFHPIRPYLFVAVSECEISFLGWKKSIWRVKWRIYLLLLFVIYYLTNFFFLALINFLIVTKKNIFYF